MLYALQTLWHERQRYWSAIVAVSFSFLLMVVQCGLLLGMFEATSIPVDRARADIWVGHPEVASIDLGQSLPEAWLSYLTLPEVAQVEPYFCGFGFWDRSGLGNELVILIGTKLDDEALGPISTLTREQRWQLTEPHAVIVDEGDFGILNLSGVGDTAEVFGNRVRVVGTVSGLGNLTAPYLYCSYETARRILQLPAGHCTFFLLKCHNKEDIPKVVEKLQAYPRLFTAFTAEQFSLRSRLFWLVKTKAGIALGLSAVLGLLVGVVVVTQTLYSATASSLREFAVLRALGIPRWRLVVLIINQAFWVGVIGLIVAVPILIGIVSFTTYFGSKILLPGWLLTTSSVLTMGVAILSGLFALRSLRQVDPEKLLR